MSWTEVVSSGGPTAALSRWTRDASRNDLYLISRDRTAEEVFHWDGTTMAEHAGPTGSSYDANLELHVDATGDVLLLGGYDSPSGAALTASGPLPITGSTTWTVDTAGATRYGGGTVRYAYGGGSFIYMSLGLPAGMKHALYRRSTWDGADTEIVQLYSATDSNGFLATMFPIGSDVIMAASSKVTSQETTFAVLHNDPSDSNATVTDASAGLTGNIARVMQGQEFLSHGVVTVTDDTDTTVFTVSDTPVVVKEQVLAGIGRGWLSPDIGGTQYLIVSDGTTYSRTGTTDDFVTISDPAPVAASSIFATTVSHDGTQLMAWVKDGKGHTLDLVVASTPTGPWGHKDTAWGGPW